MTTLLTVGHGRLERAELGALLTSAGVAQLVDVRRYPGSRANPDSRREALEEWVPEAGVGYRWEPELGGRRRVPRGEDLPDPWWQVEQFRAYAGYTRTEEFSAAMVRLLTEADERRTAVMCSEAVWWRCHRRLIADVATVRHGLEVRHLMHDGSLRLHPVSGGVRQREDGALVWDGAAEGADR
ncbi:DUF488 domain-containing protein [Georgenia sp. 10Sc9-8]|uniref:DUF488 domain-containing protein n=1 Tax=Georgenia halotolerans TaxID=3028317 RepID=A0ABT5TY97_9MICO|nr:DUF488 domain-containing protein [Georgenia halotolerans]